MHGSPPCQPHHRPCLGRVQWLQVHPWTRPHPCRFPTQLGTVPLKRSDAALVQPLDPRHLGRLSWAILGPGWALSASWCLVPEILSGGRAARAWRGINRAHAIRVNAWVSTCPGLKARRNHNGMDDGFCGQVLIVLVHGLPPFAPSRPQALFPGEWEQVKSMKEQSTVIGPSVNRKKSSAVRTAPARNRNRYLQLGTAETGWKKYFRRDPFSKPREIPRKTTTNASLGKQASCIATVFPSWLGGINRA